MHPDIEVVALREAGRDMLLIRVPDDLLCTSTDALCRTVAAGWTVYRAVNLDELAVVDFLAEHRFNDLGIRLEAIGR